MALKKVIKETNEAVSWIASEYKFLLDLQEDINEIAVGKGNDIVKALRKAKRALRYLTRSEGKAERHIIILQKAIREYPELATLGGSLEIAENKLVKAFSFYRGTFQQALQTLTKGVQSQKVLIIFGKRNETTAVERKIRAIAQGIDKHLTVLVPWVDGLQAELAKIKREERRMLLKGMAAVPIVHAGTKVASAGGFLAGLLGLRRKGRAEENELQYLASSFGFSFKREFFANYHPDSDYHASFDAIARKIEELDIFKYQKSHALGRIPYMFSIASVSCRIQLGGHERLELSFPYPASDSFKVYYLEQGWRAIGTVLGRRVDYFSLNPMSRPFFYLAMTVLEAAFITFKLDSDKWVKRSWRKLKSHGYKENTELGDKNRVPYDSATDEFIFFGNDWCEPCAFIAKVLLIEKIKFREEIDLYGRSPPYIFYKGKMTHGGAQPILDALAEMYALDPLNIEKYKKMVAPPL